MLVIYHAHCNDGYTSAVIMDMKYRNQNPEYLPLAYQRAAPDPSSYRGKMVFLLDISFGLEDMKKIAANASRVVLIDHHQTCQEMLEKWTEKPANLDIIMDMKHSAAVLTWNYCFPLKPVPRFVEMIERYDIWLDNGSIEVESGWLNLALKDQGYNIDQWIKFIEDEKLYHTLITKGQLLSNYLQKHIDSIANRAARKIIKYQSKYYLILFLNCTEFVDLVAASALRNETLADVAILYYNDDRYDTTNYCFRSTDERVEAKFFAEALGGGGHRNSAGAKLKRGVPLPFEFVDDKTFKLLYKHMKDSTVPVLKEIHEEADYLEFLMKKFEFIKLV